MQQIMQAIRFMRVGLRDNTSLANDFCNVTALILERPLHQESRSVGIAAPTKRHPYCGWRSAHPAKTRSSATTT